MTLGPAYGGGGISESEVQDLIDDSLADVESDYEAADAALAAAYAAADTAAIAAANEDRVWRPRFIWDAGQQSSAGMINAAINSGTQTFIGDAKWGSAWQVSAAASTDDSGQTLGLGAAANNSFAAEGRVLFGVLRTPAVLTDVVIRSGWLMPSAALPGTDGIYFELIGSTWTMICRTGSANTTHATTLAAVADTEYRWRIRRNASTATLTLYNSSGSSILTGSQGGLPAASTSMRPVYQVYHDAITGGSPEVLGRFMRMGTEYDL